MTIVCKTDHFGQIHLLDVFLVSCHSFKQMFHTWGVEECFQNQPHLIPSFAPESCFPSLCVYYLPSYLVARVLCGVLFPAEQKPRNNPSIRTVSEVLWNVTVTPWVHSEVWCLVLDCSVTLPAFTKCLFVVLGSFIGIANI